MGPDSSEIFSASTAGLDTSSKGNRWFSNVNVPVSDGDQLNTPNERRGGSVRGCQI
jgi:hypothetical protein